MILFRRASEESETSDLVSREFVLRAMDTFQRSEKEEMHNGSPTAAEHGSTGLSRIVTLKPKHTTPVLEIARPNPGHQEAASDTSDWIHHRSFV